MFIRGGVSHTDAFWGSYFIVRNVWKGCLLMVMERMKDGKSERNNMAYSSLAILFLKISLGKTNHIS